MGSIFGIIGGLASLACLIFYIIAIVKAFQAGDILWGILNIIFGITGLIYLFIKGHKKLGIYWVIAIIVAVVAGVLGGGSLMPAMPVPA